MQIFKKVVIFLLCFLVVERFCYFQTEGFTRSKLISNLSYNPLWNVPPLLEEKEVNTILSQPFHFLGSGKQSYAFESKDGKYVLKFIKQSRKRSIPWLTRFKKFKTISSFILKREKRLQNLLVSIKIAATTLQQETAVVYAHLTPQIHKEISLKDKIGIVHTLDLYYCQYVIQKKATLIKPPLSKKRVEEIFSLVQSQCHKKIANLDCILERNFGFLEDRAVVIDLGSFLKKEELGTRAYLQQEIFMELLPLRAYLQKHHPELIDDLDLHFCKK